MTHPAFVLPTDESERLELEELLGVELTPPAELTDAARDAYVSDLLRALGEAEAERSRYLETKGAEIARIEMRYQARLDACAGRAQLLRDAIGELARIANYGPKRKSREVGFGTYGLRLVPEKITIVDANALLDFAEAMAPEIVRVQEKRDVPHAAVKEYVKTRGDVPPGVEITPAHDEPFAKAAQP